MLRPAAIIFVNNDLTDNVQAMLVKQLYISEVLDGYVFDQHIVDDSSYVNNQKLLNRRILVKRTLATVINRDFADIVGFVSHGLIAVLKNKLGPHEKTFSIVNLDWNKLLL